MFLPISIAVGSVFLGWVLGIVGNRESASRATASALSTFALVAALAVVLAQLLPDALGAVGLPALFVFGVAAAFPSVLRQIALKLGRSNQNRRVGLELGYAGLLIHKAADGVGLATYGAGEHAEHAHFDVLFAIAAHTVPLVAVLTISFYRARGLGSSVLRVGGLAVATVIGVFATALIPESAHDAVEPWLTAAVAGLLLHIVAHDFRPKERPRGLGARVIDLVAVAAGLGLVLLAEGGHHHGEGGGQVRADTAAALLDLSLETAPALLLGLLVAAVLTTFGKHLPARWLASGGSFRQAVRGAIVGAPLPICACGVLPIAASLKKRGAGAALVVAFLVSTPELGIETLALTARFVGWPFALVRLGAAVLLAIVAALVVHRVSSRKGRESFVGAIVEPDAHEATTPVSRRMVDSFDELLYHIAPWTVVGLITAAYVQAVLPTDALGGMATYGLDILIVVIIAVPSYVCAASATPLAAVLLLKGMSPGAVLIGLLLGPATNLATLGFLRKSYGGRATVFGIGALVLAAIGLALAINHVGLPLDVSSAASQAHEHSWFTVACGALLALALLRSIWQTGLRPWLASLGESLSGDHTHHHHHGHGHHGHAHHGHAQDDHAHHGHDHAHHDGGHAHECRSHAHEDHAHRDHAHRDHAHEDHAHEDHAHEDHAHGDHAHGDHAHGDHAHHGHGHTHEGPDHEDFDDHARHAHGHHDPAH